MNTDKAQSEENGKSPSVLGAVVSAAGLAAATYAAKNPEKVVRVAKKVLGVGRSALKKVVKIRKSTSKRTKK